MKKHFQKRAMKHYLSKFMFAINVITFNKPQKFLLTWSTNNQSPCDFALDDNFCFKTELKALQTKRLLCTATLLSWCWATCTHVCQKFLHKNICIFSWPFCLRYSNSGAPISAVGRASIPCAEALPSLQMPMVWGQLQYLPKKNEFFTKYCSSATSLQQTFGTLVWWHILNCFQHKFRTPSYPQWHTTPIVC